MRRRTVLWLVPARGGSKGVPHKNLRSVGGIPLVARAVRRSRQAAVAVPEFDHEVICSTDSHAIADVAKSWGAKVPFLRPAELASDQAASIDVALHACDWFKTVYGQDPDVLVLVQPTSPLTPPGDLAAALRLHDERADDPIVTVADASHAAWSYDVADGRLVPLSKSAATNRRQDAPPVVGLNGAAYVASPAFLREHRRFVVDGRTRPSVMAPSVSVDIDREDQILICDAAFVARPLREFSIGTRRIGPGYPCYVIAEGGVNHNGDLAVAHKLVDAAADAGADAVKFQTFDPEKLAAFAAPKAAYQERTTDASESHKTMLEALVLSRQAHHELADHARARGIEFLSSPFDEGSADFLMELGLNAFKVPSGEITNLPFLRHIAKFQRPMLISTGMCDLVEVAEAVDTVQQAGDPPVALFHCVSQYPAAPRAANLRAMQSLASAFGLPVGWSDHTAGIEIGLASVALGASLVEKHLTLSRSLPGPDHSASLEPADFHDLVRGLRNVESAIGDGIKRPQAEEIAMRTVARKSLHWKNDLPASHVIGPDDLVALRPGDGLPPARIDQLLGSPLGRSVTGGTQASIDDLAPSHRARLS